MVDQSYVDNEFEHFLLTAQDDKQAAAILTLAQVIADIDAIGVHLQGDLSGYAVQVEAKVKQESD